MSQQKSSINNGNISSIPKLSRELCKYRYATKGNLVWSRPVSKVFRSEFLNLFGISCDPNQVDSQSTELLRLAAIFLPGGHSDYAARSEDHHILLKYDFAMSVMRPGHTSKDVSVRQVLSEFQKRFWKLEVEESNRWERKALTVTGQRLPIALKKALDEEFARFPEEMVDFVHGYPWEPKHAQSSLDTSKISEVERVQEYLNDIPDETFQGMRARIPDALDLIDRRKEWSQMQKRHQRAILARLQVDMKPHYQAVSQSPRLYPAGASWLGLKREVRNELTVDLWKFDISSAQLMITSALWKYQVQVENGSAWTYLLHQCGKQAHNAEFKGHLKEFIYSALFGMGKTGLNDLAWRIGCKNLINDPQVVSILKARERVIQDLKSGRELEDAWGRSYRVTNASNLKEMSQVKSIMACVAQSYELKLLLPVFDYAEQHDLQIVGLLHDGIYCSGDWSQHVEIIKDLVNQESLKVLGIPIGLDVKAPEQSKPEVQLAA